MNNQDPDKLPDDTSKNAKYENALKLLEYEGTIAWQINILFIALNVGIGAVISNPLSDISNHVSLILIFSVIGILINTAWLGTFRRNNRYYHFRMAQACEAEPEGWKLLENRGYKFSKGDLVKIEREGILEKDKIHQLSSFEKSCSNKRAIGLAIWIFIVGFAILLLISTILLIFPCIWEYCNH